MQCKQTQEFACTIKHTHAYTSSLSLTHTRTHTRMQAHQHTRGICPRDRKYIKQTYIYIIPKVWLAAQQSLLRLSPNTLY